MLRTTASGAWPHAQATSETFARSRRSSISDACGCVPDVTDTNEFEAFVRRSQDVVSATAVRLLGNPAEGEDVAANGALEGVSATSRTHPSFLHYYEEAMSLGQYLKVLAEQQRGEHIARFTVR